MTVIALATAIAAVAAVATVVWTLSVLFDIGSDGLGAGPWQRPEARPTHSRLPADFIGLWSLFGSRSIDALAGSRESAVRRLARLEANLRGQRMEADGGGPMPSGPTGGGESFEPGWLERRLDDLEILAGLPPGGADGRAGQAVRSPSPSQPATGQPSPARGRS